MHVGMHLAPGHEQQEGFAILFPLFQEAFPLPHQTLGQRLESDWLFYQLILPIEGTVQYMDVGHKQIR